MGLIEYDGALSLPAEVEPDFGEIVLVVLVQILVVVVVLVVAIVEGLGVDEGCLVVSQARQHQI